MGVFRTQQTRPFSFDLRPLGLFRSLTKLLAFGKKAARKTQKQSQMPGDLWGQSRSDSGRCSFCGDFRGRASAGPTWKGGRGLSDRFPRPPIPPLPQSAGSRCSLARGPRARLGTPCEAPWDATGRGQPVGADGAPQRGWGNCQHQPSGRLGMGTRPLRTCTACWNLLCHAADTGDRLGPVGAHESRGLGLHFTGGPLC